MKRNSILVAILLTLASTPVVMAEGWETYDETIIESWEETYNTGDAEAVAGFYTEDGIRMPPNDLAVEGREAIAAFIQQGMEMGLAQVQLEVDEIAASGDMGFARGTWVATDTDGNEVDRGKWLQVGKKVGDSWYAHRDIWNSDNPLPE